MTDLLRYIKSKLDYHQECYRTLPEGAQRDIAEVREVLTRELGTIVEPKLAPPEASPPPTEPKPAKKKSKKKAKKKR